MKLNSYALKVAFWSCLVSGLVLVIFSTGMTYQAKYDFAEIVDRNIENLAAALVEGAKEDSYSEDPFKGPLSFAKNSYAREIDDEGRSVVLLAILKPDETFSYKDESYWKSEYKTIFEKRSGLFVGRFLSKEDQEQAQNLTEEIEDRWEIRVYRRDGYSIYLAVNQDENKDEYLEVLHVSYYVLPSAFIIIALGGWWIGVYAVKPMKEISNSVASIKSDDLGKRVPHAERKDELGELAQLVNGMLDRIERGYNQAKRFTADASHELRTPLAILQGEIEARMRDNKGSDEADGRMLEEIRRLKTLTNSLLFLSKADAGGLKIEGEHFNFSSLCKRVFKDIEDVSADSDLSFDDSSIEQDITLPGDSSFIHQSVMNLLRNAVKFNRIKGKVSCSLKTKGQFAHLRVGNTGPAIPKESRKRIFERFFRIDKGRNRNQGGFGLGLNIVREIARAHGGDVALLRSENDWTEFEMRLPL